MANKPKIIIVDDSETICLMLKRFLEVEMNAQVETYNDGLEMVKSLTISMPDALILDYYLDQTDTNALNGIQLTQLLRKHNFFIPIIFLTGKRNNIDETTLNALGVDVIINKNGDEVFDQVLSALKKLISFSF